MRYTHPAACLSKYNRSFDLDRWDLYSVSARFLLRCSEDETWEICL